jgi:hypothetical protein
MRCEPCHCFAIGVRKPVRGATLLECVVALTLLGAALTLGVQALGWSAAQRRLAQQRHVAMQEAANCLEQVRQLPWSELNHQRLAQLKLSAEAQRQLASAELRVTSETAGEQHAIKVRVEIQWLSRAGGTPWQVSLVTWRYNTEKD